MQNGVAWRSHPEAFHRTEQSCYNTQINSAAVKSIAVKISYFADLFGICVYACKELLKISDAASQRLDSSVLSSFRVGLSALVLCNHHRSK